MKIKKDAINCAIHNGIIINPVNCVNCNNLFCSDCAERVLKSTNTCPLCYISPFKYIKNNSLKNILLKPNEDCIECQKCKKLFNENDYDEHKKICIQFKCKLCNKYYNNNEDIKNHIINDEIHINQLTNFFDTNKGIIKGIGIYSNTIQPYRYLNLLYKSNNIKLNNENEKNENIENEYSLIQIKLDNIPKNCILNKDMDLYFCNSKTNINCKCCPDHFCLPGNCLCKTCMDINKKYHGLKSYHLINKAGRAARYSRKHFHCYCKFIRKSVSEGGNIFFNQFYCGQFQYCDACQILDGLIDSYLSPEIVSKIKNKV